MQGAKGTDIVDDTVWVVKTHYPWIPPEPNVFSASRSLVVVRNPLDSIVSWYHYLSEVNHTTKAAYDVAADHPDYFDWWVRDLVPKMRKQYALYLEEARTKKAPYLFIRFEDLVSQPKP